jgi:hypothetical protein
MGRGVSYTLTDRVREFHVKTEEEAQQKNRFASRGCGLVSPGLPSLTEQERIVTKVERSLLAAGEFERQIEIDLNWIKRLRESILARGSRPTGRLVRKRLP